MSLYDDELHIGEEPVCLTARNLPTGLEASYQIQEAFRSLTRKALSCACGDCDNFMQGQHSNTHQMQVPGATCWKRAPFGR